MQVGDLVQHRFEEHGAGIILEMGEIVSMTQCVHDRLTLVRFAIAARARYYRARDLEVVNASK
jgi:hypothetical protein